MSDEIKEILGSMSEYLEEKKKDYEEIVIKSGFLGDSIVYEAYYEDIKTLFDYITNLQEEKEDYKSRCEKGIAICDEMLEVLYHYTDRKIFEDIKDVLIGGDKE